MRRLFLELYHKQIFPFTPITSFSSFLSYIVVTPLMLGFEKDFSCHSHLGPIRIPPLFSFPPAPFPRNEKEDGTLELYYLSAYCLPKILLLQLVGHRVIQISCVFRGFPMLQLPYQFQPFLLPLLKQYGFMFLHWLVIPLCLYLFFQFRSRLVYKIEWPILLRTLDSIVFQECWAGYVSHVSGRNFKEGLSVFCTLFRSCSY